MQLSVGNLDFQQNCQGDGFATLHGLKSCFFKRGQHLMFSSRQESLWHIHSGYVRTFSLEEDGTVIPLGFWSAGDLVGQTLSSLDPYEIECITDITATELPRTYEVPPQIVVSHLHQTQAFVRIMHQPTVEDKLLKFLEMLAHRFGHQAHDGLSIEPYLTHEQIANSIGTSRITVTKLMGQLKRSGKIRWSYKHRSLQEL